MTPLLRQLLQHDRPRLGGQVEDALDVLHGLARQADDEVELELGEAVAEDQPHLLEQERVGDRLAHLHPQLVGAGLRAPG